MALAPVASEYARTPQDMRLLRMLLPQRKAIGTTAYYIGVANGDDFYSWLNVGMGINTGVHWIGVDIREECVWHVAQVTHQSGIPCQLCVHDYRQGIPYDLDVVVANRIWETRTERNQAGLKTILDARPHLLITRGHGLDENQLLQIIPQGYRLYSHANQRDDYHSAVAGYFYVKDNTWVIDKECPHTRISCVK